jgi:PmbA protein
MNELDWLEKRLSGLPVDGYEIFAVEARQFSAEAKDGQIDSLDEAIERGAAVRLFQGRKTGFGSSSDLSPAFLERMADLAYNGLSVVEDGPMLALPAAIRDRSPFVQLSWTPDDRQRKLQMALDLEKFAKDFDPRVKRVRDACYAEEVRTVTLKNSRGLERKHSASRHELSLMVMAEDGQGQEMAWESDFATDPDKLDPRKIAREGAEKAVTQLGGRPVPTQKMPAVLDAMVAASFLGVLSSSFFGDQVLRNRSSLRGKMGREIYSRQVSVIDDGRLEGGYNSFPFDGEGVPTTRRALVEKGTLKEFLYDLTSATQANASSTGNGVRPGVKEPPRVGATNFFIEPGGASLEELLRDLGRGFWVRDVIGVHTADAVTGDFSLGASGVWIEGGKRASPVRGVTVSGNLHELLKRVVRVGKEIRRYHAFGAPPLLIESLDIGGL